MSHSFIRIELKYCERCGGLWFRIAGSNQHYCPPCAPKMAELPPPRRPSKRRGRPPARNQKPETRNRQSETRNYSSIVNLQSSTSLKTVAPPLSLPHLERQGGFPAQASGASPAFAAGLFASFVLALIAAPVLTSILQGAF
jgi:hypothetical protein